MRNFEVVQELNKFGVPVKSVPQLRKIMFRLGLIQEFDNTWTETEWGLEFTGYKGSTVGAYEWQPKIVPYLVAKIEEDETLLGP